MSTPGSQTRLGLILMRRRSADGFVLLMAEKVLVMTLGGLVGTVMRVLANEDYYSGVWGLFFLGRGLGLGFLST